MLITGYANGGLKSPNIPHPHTSIPSSCLWVRTMKVPQSFFVTVVGNARREQK